MKLSYLVIIASIALVITSSLERVDGQSAPLTIQTDKTTYDINKVGYITVTGKVDKAMTPRPDVESFVTIRVFDSDRNEITPSTYTDYNNPNGYQIRIQYGQKTFQPNQTYIVVASYDGGRLKAETTFTTSEKNLPEKKPLSTDCIPKTPPDQTINLMPISDSPYFLARITPDENDVIGTSVKNLNVFVDSLGYLHAIGEFVNNQEATLKFVQVHVTLYDSGGRVLDNDFSFTLADIVPPYSKIPFEVVFRGGAEGVQELGAEYSFIETVDMPILLKVDEPTIFRDEYGYTHIIGVVTNTADTAAHYVKVIASIYNKKGELTRTLFTFTKNVDIYPNQWSTFEITEDGLEGKFDSVAIYAESAEYGSTYSIKFRPITITTSDLNIPTWIKNNACWWVDGKITDSDYFKGLQYLIKKEIIRVSPGVGSPSMSSSIPNWVKFTTERWAEGQITDSEFVRSIQFLIINGKI